MMELQDESLKTMNIESPKTETKQDILELKSSDSEESNQTDDEIVDDDESEDDMEESEETSESGESAESVESAESKESEESDVSSILDVDDDMNTNWIDDYEEYEKKYEDYYLESMEGVKTMFIYVNKKREIESIHEDYIELQANNILTKEELLFLIKNNNNPKNLKNEPTKKKDPYKLLSVLVYNIDLQPKQLKEYLEKKHPAPQENPYLYSLKILEDIQFKKSISLFHDINTVYFIYYDNSHTKNINNKTKKIYANKTASNTSHNKTKRKQLKE